MFLEIFHKSTIRLWELRMICESESRLGFGDRHKRYAADQNTCILAKVSGAFLVNPVNPLEMDAYPHKPRNVEQ